MTARMGRKRFIWCAALILALCAAIIVAATGLRLPEAKGKTVKKDGKKISSSAVKELLSSGDVDKAAELLGSAFKIAGRVERGRSDGAKLGFKTANLQYPADKAEIMRGVYATKTVIDGVTYPSLTNVGAALTFGLNNTLVETHVIGFDGEIYGKTISVSFVKFLRENRKFSSAEELKNQIEKDLKFYD